MTVDCYSNRVPGARIRRPGRFPRALVRNIIPALAVLILAGAALGGCQSLRLGSSEAELALEDIAAGARPSRLKQRTPAPVRRTIDYRVDGRPHAADEYLSPAGVRAGIILVPGVAVTGKDDPRLMAFATSLARLGFAVLVPDIASLRRLQIRAHNVGEVVDAFRYLASRPELADRVGIAGFSYGAGPVLLASLQPAISEQVRFVVSIGGYFDLRRLVAYLTTGRYPQAAAQRLPAPHPYTRRVLARSNAALLQQPGDRQFLEALADRRVSIEQAPPDLGADARAVLRLLENREPSRVQPLIDALPDAIRAELDGLNPARADLSRAKAKYLLLHGRHDNLVPYLESLALADRLPAGHAELFLIDGLIHMDLAPKRHDIPRLIEALQALLAQRD